MSVDGSPLLLIGCAGHNLRGISPICECDAGMRTCMTRSRNIYQLLGEPAQILDEGTAEPWKDWTKKNGVISTTDVTEAVAADFGQVDAERGFWQEKMPPDFPQEDRKSVM